MTVRLKLHCNENSFNIYAALFFTFIINALFLKQAWETIPYSRFHDYLFAATLPVVLFSAFLFLFSVAALPWLRKPLLIILLISSATANYFLYNFGPVIDGHTVQTLLASGVMNSLRSLLLPGILTLLTVAFISFITIHTNRPWWMNIAFRAVIALSCLVLVLLVAALFYRDYAALIRDNKNLVALITPANVVTSIEAYAEIR